MNKINIRLGLLDHVGNKYKETNALNSKTWRKKYERNLMSSQEQSWHGISDFIEPESLLLKLFKWPKTVQPTPSEYWVKRKVKWYSGQSYNKKSSVQSFFIGIIVDVFSFFYAPFAIGTWVSNTVCNLLSFIARRNIWYLTFLESVCRL